MSEPLAVGLVGAGPWAAMVHAPVLAAGPETRLVGIWNRTPEKAEELAKKHGARAFARYEELLDSCEAVAFCVSPEVQADVAVDAARAGKAVLLEKPLALDIGGAQRIVDAVGEAGVASLVVLSFRYSQGVREFLDKAASFDAFAGRGCFLSGAFLGGPFAYGWRLERGGLLDVGPHIIDLADAALGPTVDVRAHGDRRWTVVHLQHESGALSEIAISCYAGVENRTEIELFGEKGSLHLDARAVTGPRAFALLRKEFAEAARAGGGHHIDAARGLHLQRLLDAAQSQLA